MREDAYLSVDIGGTKTAFCVIEGGKPHGVQRIPTRPEEGCAALCERIFLLCEGEKRFERISVACPGPLDIRGKRTGTIVTMGWKDVPVWELFRRKFDCPVFVLNDCLAAAWGEYRFGAGRGASMMAYLSLSTGVGGGIVADGRLLTGAGGNAADFGHMRVPHGEEMRCGCGGVNCLELFASGTAISGRYRSLSGERLTAAEILQRAERGDANARAVFDEAADKLNVALCVLTRILDPDRIVIGGGMSAALGLMSPRLTCPVKPVLAELGGRQELLGCWDYFSAE